MNRQFTPPSALLVVIAGRRYNGAAQALHWLTALLMFAVLPLAWVMVAVTRDYPSRDALFTLHKSIGMTILALTIVRLVWRGANSVPAFPGKISRWETVPAKLSHWLLYLILLVMPISGYVLSTASGHPVTFFGLFEFPSLPQNKLLAQLAVDIHLLTQWVVYALIALHILATTWHILLRRDAVLDRMLPEQRNAE